MLFAVLVLLFATVTNGHTIFKGICGRPALLLGMNPLISEFLLTKFADGQNFKYRCREDEYDYKQELICLNGSWSGQRLRCGQSIRGYVIKAEVSSEIGSNLIAIKKPSDYNSTQKNVENYSSTRFQRLWSEGSPSLQEHGSVRNWTLTLDRELDVAFVRLDLFLKQSQIGKELELTNLINVLYLKSSESRTCKQVKKRLKKKVLENSDGVPSRRFDFWFECDLVDSRNEIKKTSKLQFRTLSKAKFDIDLF